MGQLCECGGAGWRKPSVGGPAVRAWGCGGAGGPVWEAQLCAHGGAGWRRPSVGGPAL